MEKCNSGDAYFWEKVANVLKQHAVGMVAFICLCCLTSLVISAFFIKPQYQADASLIVNTRESNSTAITSEQLNSAEELANLYGIIIKSDTVLDAVIRDLQLNTDYETLVQKVSVTSVSNTSVMRISVKDTDGAYALNVLKSIVFISPQIISDMVEAGSVKVVSEPRLLKDAVSPDLKRCALGGALFGVVAVCAAALLRAVSEDRFYSRREVESRLGLTVIGEIPEQVSKYGRRKKGGTGTQCALLTRSASFSFKEAFRYLRMMTTKHMPIDGSKTIVVTSAAAGEGKSCISINLALSLAADSKRVLLVECDMRKPTICAYLGIRNAPEIGLSALLQGASVLQEALVQKNGITVLPAGDIPENPTELLSAERMRALLKVLEECYDYIILDTPPSADMADAVALSSDSGGVLFVIRQGYADGQVVEAACDKLRNSDANILGAILNRCVVETSAAGKHAYGYGYGYSYTGGRNARSSRL